MISKIRKKYVNYIDYKIIINTDIYVPGQILADSLMVSSNIDVNFLNVNVTIAPSCG